MWSRNEKKNSKLSILTLNDADASMCLLIVSLFTCYLCFPNFVGYLIYEY